MRPITRTILETAFAALITLICALTLAMLVGICAAVALKSCSVTMDAVSAVPVRKQ